MCLVSMMQKSPDAAASTIVVPNSVKEENGDFLSRMVGNGLCFSTKMKVCI